MVVSDRIDRVSVIIEVEQEIAMWLAVGKASNYWNVVEDNHCT